MADDDTGRGRPSGWTEHTPRATGEIDISIAYSNPSTDRLMNLYAGWAESYDSDLIDAYGYMAPADAVAAFTALGLADASVLDAGCGTGQAGALLAAAGYIASTAPTSRPKCATWRPASALPEPLPARHDSRLRAADRRRHRHRAGPAPPYDAVICVGVFGYGPPYVADLPRVMDAAAGAPVLITVNGMGW